MSRVRETETPKCDRVGFMNVFQDPGSCDSAEIYKPKVTRLRAERGGGGYAKKRGRNGQMEISGVGQWIVCCDWAEKCGLLTTCCTG